MRQEAKAELLIILLVATVLELVLDALLGEALRQYIPIPQVTGFGVVVLLLIVLWWRIEKMEIFLGGRSKMARNVGVKVFKFGKIGMVEVAAIVAYFLAALAVFNLATLGDSLSFVTDFAWLICIGAIVVVFGADKRRKINIAGLEGLALIIAVVLPLAAAGYLVSVGIDLSSYLADATQSLILFLVSVASAVVVASQD
jgi:hypothetical protein